MSEQKSNELIRVAAVHRTPSGPAWSFTVSPGEALWISDAHDSEMAWLNWLSGIEPPPRGEVFWKGVEWHEWSADKASEERGRMGCVFAAGGAVVNLDMDENVWLPSRMHRREGAEEAIEQWARFFGCWPLPQVRASTLSERERRRILWVRAFSGNPEVLILERPLRELRAEDGELFLEAVKKMRTAGCAVVWLDETLADNIRMALEPLVCAAPEAN